MKPISQKRRIETIKDDEIIFIEEFDKSSEVVPESIRRIDPEKMAIAMDVLREYPATLTGTTALIKLVEAGLSTNAEEVLLRTEMTLADKRYAAKMVVTWKEI